MIFQETWEKVLGGEKTQTRRLVKPHHTKAGQPQYKVGQVHAVQPGRAMRSIWWRSEKDGSITSWIPDMENYSLWKKIAGHPYNGGWKQLRIRITDVRREPVRDISIEDATAEGFHCGDQHYADVSPFIMVWQKLHTKPGTRWQDNPMVWVISFEAIRE
jgi:hypothetical protein